MGGLKEYQEQQRRLKEIKYNAEMKKAKADLAWQKIRLKRAKAAKEEKERKGFSPGMLQ